jgi:hypothetical protein
MPAIREGYELHPAFIPVVCECLDIRCRLTASVPFTYVIPKDHRVYHPACKSLAGAFVVERHEGYVLVKDV